MSPAASATAAQAFGRDALGPILAEFCLRLWLYQRFLAHPDNTVILFCARGGLRLQLVYDRFLERSGLPVRIASDNLMISRLVAARTASRPPSGALLDELGREFAGRPMTEVAAALAQRDDIKLEPEWQKPFSAERFARLLSGNQSGAAAIRSEIAVQDRRFRAHLDQRAGARRNVILCDTGLYGSTVRLLGHGAPDRNWRCLQFARSNYKRLDTEHFTVTRGISVESDNYRPWEARTSALRFWHLIEAALEPDLPSVRSYFAAEGDAAPRSNLEVDGWERRIAPDAPGLFSGAMEYIDSLDRAALPGVPNAAARGWSRYKRAVVWPGREAVAALSLPDRSQDFGRVSRVAQFAPSGVAGSLARVRDSLWREGALVRMFPRTGWAVLPLIEMAHAGRALWAETASFRPAPSRPREWRG